MPTARAHLTGSRIRDLRLDRGIRQADLARMAGISASYLNLIEHNRRRIAGKLLLDIAAALRVEPAVLSEGAASGLVAALRDAAAAFSTTAETDRTEEFAGRFPGWAGLIGAQSRRMAALERTVEALNDRLAHDPFLSASLHDVLTTVTAIRSTSAILADGDDIEPEWQARFHRNLHEDSQRLAESSRALVAYLDAAADPDRVVTGAQEEVEAWFEARGWRHDAPPPADEELSAAGESLLQTWRGRLGADAAALPAGALQEAAAAGADPADLAAAFGVDLARMLRRLALLPDRASPAGLVICDGSGTLILRRPVDGFPLPRFGAACPLWPLYQALARPMTPVRALVEMAGRSPRLFLVHAVAHPATPASFDVPPVFEATMLVEPAPRDAAGTAQPVGTSCRVCPRAGCPARREPSILADAF